MNVNLVVALFVVWCIVVLLLIGQKELERVEDNAIEKSDSLRDKQNKEQFIKRLKNKIEYFESKGLDRTPKGRHTTKYVNLLYTLHMMVNDKPVERQQFTRRLKRLGIIEGIYRKPIYFGKNK